MRRKALGKYLRVAAILAAVAAGWGAYHVLWGGYDGTRRRDVSGAQVPGWADTRVRAAIAAAREAIGQPDRPDWVARSLEAVDTGLDLCPPAEGDWALRRELLSLSDVPINARRNDAWKRAVGAFHRRRIHRALDEIAAARVGHGIRIWRMYNMGFVVRSADATIGFDLHPGWVFDGAMTPADRRRLAGLLDVAFVSHNHPDHLSRELVGDVLKAGGKVVLPEKVAKDITGPNVVRLWDTGGECVKVGPVEVCAYPGRHYGDVLVRVCVYVVRVGGLRMMHQGDNRKESLYPGIAAAGRVEVLLANCWADPDQCITAIRPALVITGHENEIRHPRGMRTGFGKTFEELDALGIAPPWKPGGTRAVILHWGEQTRWPPESE